MTNQDAGEQLSFLHCVYHFAKEDGILMWWSYYRIDWKINGSVHAYTKNSNNKKERMGAKIN